MSKVSLKQIILNSIEKLPQDASLEEIILNIYTVHNGGTEKKQRESDIPADLWELCREIGIN